MTILSKNFDAGSTFYTKNPPTAGILFYYSAGTKQRRDAAKQGAETNGAEEDAEELADGSEEGLRVEGIRIG